MESCGAGYRKCGSEYGSPRSRVWSLWNRVYEDMEPVEQDMKAAELVSRVNQKSAAEPFSDGHATLFHMILISVICQLSVSFADPEIQAAMPA